MLLLQSNDLLLQGGLINIVFLKNIKMIIFFILINLTFLPTESKDFCEVKNILLLFNDKIENCEINQIIFGYINFNSKNDNLKFKNIDELNVKIPIKFQKEILLFIKNNCHKNNLKIKTITNLIKNTNINEYNNKIIVSCRFK